MKLKLQIASLILMTVLFACNNKTEEKEASQFELNGTMEGIKDGNIVLSINTTKLQKRDTVKVIDGKFTITGNYPTPMRAKLTLDDGMNPKDFFTQSEKMILLENVKMELKGSAGKFHQSVITGSKKQDEYEIFLKDANKIKNKYIPVFKAMRENDPKVNPTKEEKEKARQEYFMLYKKQDAEMKKLSDDFIKKYPKAYLSGLIIESRTYGMSGEQIMTMLGSLSPELRKHEVLVELGKKVKEKLAVEIGIENIMIGASNVSYKVDKGYKGEMLQGIVYLAAFANNNICALLYDGSVQILDPAGKVMKKFKPELKGSASSLSVDADDRIYVMSTLMKEKKIKIRGKIKSHKLPMGVECHVFDVDGKELLKYTLKDTKTATGTRVVDENLMVADCMNKKISMFNKKTGEYVTTIEDMRPCCGILDFSVNNKKELLVANLGAFKVQGYDYNGKITVAFGSRGKKLDDFHGCCNPVSVASLSNGAIVTVEKDPTRIKIYSKEGAKQISGIEELVEGCSYIPMIVDSMDNLYLASRKKGIIKCIAS